MTCWCYTQKEIEVSESRHIGSRIQFLQSFLLPLGISYFPPYSGISTDTLNFRSISYHCFCTTSLQYCPRVNSSPLRSQHFDERIILAGYWFMHDIYVQIMLLSVWNPPCISQFPSKYTSIWFCVQSIRQAESQPCFKL